ncbi:zinc ribbon domain-containing protein [Methanobrevibacter sp.]
MYCSNCGEYNEEDAIFCKKCGAKFENDNNPTEIEKKSSKNKIIIISLVSVVMVLALCVFFAGGSLKGDIPLETQNFSIFQMDVPVGSDFVETQSIPNYGFGGLITLENTGNYSNEVGIFMVSNIGGSSHPREVSLERTEGDIKVFKDREGDAYFIQRDIGDYHFVLMGRDDETMIKMLESIKMTDTE